MHCDSVIDTVPDWIKNQRFLLKQQFEPRSGKQGAGGGVVFGFPFFVVLKGKQSCCGDFRAGSKAEFYFLHSCSWWKPATFHMGQQNKVHTGLVLKKRMAFGELLFHLEKKETTLIYYF